jgi:hypothetical protein
MGIAPISVENRGADGTGKIIGVRIRIVCSICAIWKFGWIRRSSMRSRDNQGQISRNILDILNSNATIIGATWCVAGEVGLGERQARWAKQSQ